MAKGWIVEKASQLLSAYTRCCAVSAGGDILPDGQTTWEVALEDPYHQEQDLLQLQITPGAVAASSVTKRNWRQGSMQRHHIIDPSSGEPAVSTWLSVTVIAERAVTAEVYAKVLLIAGPEQAINKWMFGLSSSSYNATIRIISTNLFSSWRLVLLSFILLF